MEGNLGRLADWAFVDDTNPAIMDPTNSLTANELIEQLRIAGQLWENLLHISGGALNLSKCSWSLQFWEWRNGRPCLQPLNTYDSPLLMTQGECPDANIIHRIDNTTAAWCTLGVYMNASGTFSQGSGASKSFSRTPLIASLWNTAFKDWLDFTDPWNEINANHS